MTGAAAFPAPIATAIQAWEAETDLFRRQARLLACFEALVQYAAIVAVSEFHRAGLDRELPDVDGLIREVIHRPSTGTWQRIYREAAGAFRNRRSALVSDALYRFGFDDAGRQQPSMLAADKLIQLRNEQKGHGHVLTDAEYQAIIDRYDGYLRGLLQAAEFARELTLCVVLERSAGGVSAGRLMGPVESAGPRDEFPPADDAPPPGHVAARHAGTGRWIDLAPLLLYLECEREVERIDPRGNRTRERCGRPGVFFHHELVPPSRVRGFEFRFAHHSSWRFPDFDFVGDYLERYGRRAGTTTEAEWYQARIAEATRFFVGREEPLRQLTAIAEGEPRRVAFVTAGPGLGKSTLLARWIARMESDPAASGRVLICRHFIQEQYPETGRASHVFDILRHQLCARFGLDPTPPYPDGRSRADRYRAALIESLRLAVQRHDKPSITLVIDGLDEAMRVTAGEDEALLDWIPGPDLLPAGVSLVLSGRPSVEANHVFQARFGRSVAEYLELTHLDDAEVLEWFELAFGAVYALENRAFLEQVAAAAGGHPQYLHFVHSALKDGSLQPGDANRLPAGLEDFYSRVMTEAAGEQPAALRVIALLAATSAPLGLGTLAAILGESPDATAHACDAARNVLEWDPAGQVLLFDAAFAEWVRAGEVRTPAGALRREIHTTMAARLLDWCRDWSGHRNPYAASHLVEHLVAAGYHDEVAAMARNPEFIVFQASARPDAPDLPQATFRAALHRATTSGNHAATAEFGLRRVAWATTVLTESPLDAVHKGSLDRARRLAHLHEPAERLTWYLVLARELLSQQGAAPAEQFLGLPGRLAWWPAGRDGMVADLTTAADAMVALHPLPNFAALWRHYLSDQSRSRLALGLASLGRLDEAEQIVGTIPACAHRDEALIGLAEKLIENGEMEHAYRCADGMWLSKSRWEIRERIVASSAPKQGLAVLDAVDREAGRDPVRRDGLVQKISASFSGAGRLEDAAVAARRIVNWRVRDDALAVVADDAIRDADIDTAARVISEITPGDSRRRSLLDHAGLSALRRVRLGDLTRVLRADPTAVRLLVCLAILTAAIAGGVIMPALARFSHWGPVVWLVAAFTIAVGLREGSWRAGASAFLWASLTALSMQLLSDTGPRGVAATMMAGGLALFFAAIGFGLDRFARSLRVRAVTVALTAVAVAGVLTAIAGPRLTGWTSGSDWLAFALLLPGGAAVGAAALAPVTVVEERLAYQAAALLPVAVLLAAGDQRAGGLPMLLLMGWTIAGLARLGLNAIRAVRLPGVPALFLAMSEALRGGWASLGLMSSPGKDDAVSASVFIVVIIVSVAVIRRQKGIPASAAETSTAETPAARIQRSLADVTRNPRERTARFRAELLLRLARRFPSKGGRLARLAARDAATAAAGLSAKPDDPDRLEEPVRRDLLWQVARESWRHRDPAGASRAAWLVEWRRWSGMLAAASGVVTGALAGVTLRWILERQLSFVPAGIAGTAIAVIALVTTLVATHRLRSLREAILCLPLTAVAASWILWGGQDVARWAMVPAIGLLLAAIGAPGSGSAAGWMACLGLLCRREALIAIPSGTLVAGAIAFSTGASFSSTQEIFATPAFVLVIAGLMSFGLDSGTREAASRAAKRLLPRKAKDLPPLPVQASEGVSAFERGTFSDDVATAVVRLAEREPESLPAITRAAMSVR